jgi:hypothetical protein
MSLMEDLYEEFMSAQRERAMYQRRADEAMRALSDTIVERDALRAELAICKAGERKRPIMRSIAFATKTPTR